jgi:hypothetical protein
VAKVPYPKTFEACRIGEMTLHQTPKGRPNNSADAVHGGDSTLPDARKRDLREARGFQKSAKLD